MKKKGVKGLPKNSGANLGRYLHPKKATGKIGAVTRVRKPRTPKI
jgi:hypothetical protein